MCEHAFVLELLLLDLDGVVRHFDKSVADGLEIEHGLEIGSLRREAFEHPRGHAAITGGLTRAQWASQVGEAVGSLQAARTWLNTWGTADPAMVELIRDLRATDLPVAILTNGTDTIHEELATCGLDDVFDHVFCTWYLGIAKPEPDVYRRVSADVGVDPAQVLFFDDRMANVTGARSAGMRAELFESHEQVGHIVQTFWPSAQESLPPS